MRTSVSAPLSDLLEPAFRLAFFIHVDRRCAIEVVKAAIEAFGKLSRKQRKRNWSRNEGTSPKAISLLDHAAFQFLVCVESEAREKEGEQRSPSSLSVDDLVVRYVKACITPCLTKRSLHALVAVMRVIHKYPISDCQTVHDFLTGRFANSEYFGGSCRTIKGDIFNVLAQRFGAWVKPIVISHNEFRFESQAPSRCAGLVVQCLDALTPWATCCELSKIDLLSTGALPKALKGNRLRPDRQEKAEINRTHAVVHPACFALLVSAVRLCSSLAVLDIPNFHMSSDHDANPSSRTPDPLSSDEKREIKDHVAALAHRPGVEHPHEIDVEIDGEFAGTLMLGGGIQETLTLRRGTSRIYLFERATRHLLAVHLIDYEGERITNAHAYADIGDAGRLKIIISPAADGSGNLRLQYSPPRHSWLFAWARSGPPRLQRRAILLITGCICAACVMLLAFNLISTNRLSERLSAAQSREKVLVRELAEAKASRNADEVISYSLAAVDSTLGSPKRGPDNHPPRFIVTSKTKAIELRAIVSSARETYTVSLLTLDADKPLLIEYGLKASQNDGSPLLRVILPANAFQGSVTYYLLEARSESNNGTSRRELFPFAIARQ